MNIYDVLYPLLLVMLQIAVGYIIAYLKAHMKKKDFESVQEVAKVAVNAIEQTSKNKRDMKKLEALTIIRDALNDKNIKVSDSLIDAVIEKAVREMNINAK